MIAIDTSVLVDYIGEGAAAEAAEEALRLALSAGPVVACEIVVSEVVAGLGHSDVVMETLDAIGIGFSPLELRAAVRAGEMQRRYKERIRASAIPRRPGAPCPTSSSAPTPCCSARASSPATRASTATTSRASRSSCPKPDASLRPHHHPFTPEPPPCFKPTANMPPNAPRSASRRCRWTPSRWPPSSNSSRPRRPAKTPSCWTC